MPILSKKGLSMPESPIRKLVPFAEKAKSKGIRVIHLNIGQPDIPTPEIALQAVKNQDLKVLAYSRTEGSDSYRNKLAAYYAKHQVQLTKEDIIVTTGGSEALSFAMATVADSGDEIIIPEPFYANYNGFAAANDLKVVPIASSISQNFALPPIQDFEKLINHRTKAILICNPGNPTGYLYTLKELEDLATLARKHNIFLIADEVYREFTYGNSKHHSILSLSEMEQHAIVIDSVSKRYSMCGARIGCLVSKNSDFIHTALKFAQARLSPPTYAQIAAEAALDTPASYFLGVNKEYEHRRNVLIAGLKAIPGVEVANPKGAFYCVVALPVKNADHFAQWLLESFSYEGDTVMVAPAAGFYATEGLGINEIRIAYVLEQKELLQAIHILEKALERYPN
ncbi:MAG: pyridoxal phosphate-dependent aminotransferase [Flavobacteriia bacterium]|nr:pyridoxal phosphate-dependent aminotransferase [Flavobacteriia bacterium]